MRISDWSSDVCSSDLKPPLVDLRLRCHLQKLHAAPPIRSSYNGCHTENWHIHKMHVTMHVMQRTPDIDPAQLVTRARAFLALSQHDFGSRVGKSQGLISKYEHGQVAPPAHVIIHCVNVLGGDAFDQKIGREPV